MDKLKRILVIVGLVLFVTSGVMAFQSHSADESAQRAISNQSLDLKLYGWSGTNSNYYKIYESYAEKAKTYKTLAIVCLGAGVGCVTPEIVYVIKKRKIST